MSARFAILNPCAKRWTDLSGDGRKRFCDECQTHVHALDQYSVREFEELKRNSGRVCFTAISPLMAQSGRVRIRVIDLTGAVILSAAASLLGGDDKRTWTVFRRRFTIYRELPRLQKFTIDGYSPERGRDESRSATRSWHHGRSGNRTT